MQLRFDALYDIDGQVRLDDGQEARLAYGMHNFAVQVGAPQVERDRVEPAHQPAQDPALRQDVLEEKALRA